MIARNGHPKLTKGCDLETFLNLQHISVEHANELEGVDLALDKLGFQRKISYQSQHFLTVPSALLKTNMVACLPYHLAKHYDVAIYELPVPVNPLEYYLYWHVSVENDKAHQWMRNELFKICQNYQSNSYRALDSIFDISQFLLRRHTFYCLSNHFALFWSQLFYLFFHDTEFI